MNRRKLGEPSGPDVDPVGEPITYDLDGEPCPECGWWYDGESCDNCGWPIVRE